MKYTIESAYDLIPIIMENFPPPGWKIELCLRRTGKKNVVEVEVSEPMTYSTHVDWGNHCDVVLTFKWEPQNIPYYPEMFGETEKVAKETYLEYWVESHMTEIEKVFDWFKFEESAKRIANQSGLLPLFDFDGQPLGCITRNDFDKFSETLGLEIQGFCPEHGVQPYHSEDPVCGECFQPLEAIVKLPPENWVKAGEALWEILKKLGFADNDLLPHMFDQAWRKLEDWFPDFVNELTPDERKKAEELVKLLQIKMLCDFDLSKRSSPNILRSKKSGLMFEEVDVLGTPYKAHLCGRVDGLEVWAIYDVQQGVIFPVIVSEKGPLSEVPWDPVVMEDLPEEIQEEVEAYAAWRGVPVVEDQPSRRKGMKRRVLEERDKMCRNATIHRTAEGTLYDEVVEAIRSVFEKELENIRRAVVEGESYPPFYYSYGDDCSWIDAINTFFGEKVFSKAVSNAVHKHCLGSGDLKYWVSVELESLLNVDDPDIKPDDEVVDREVVSWLRKYPLSKIADKLKEAGYLEEANKVRRYVEGD